MSTDLVSSNRCPICYQEGSQQLVYISDVPVMQNLIYEKRRESLECLKGVLDFKICNACDYAWNQQFSPDLVEYNPRYENNQLLSPRFVAHAKKISERVLSAAPESERLRMVEVGCGQGDFINLLAKFAGDRLEWAFGMDPAVRNEGTNGKVTLRRDYFNSESVQKLPGSPNVVLSRHTIEHIPYDGMFLSSIYKAIPKEGCTLLLETPDLRWIINNSAFEDLFYEHCSIFTPNSIEIFLNKNGFNAVHAENVFDGQYLWVKANVADKIDNTTNTLNQRANNFSISMDQFLEIWAIKLRDIQENGTGRICIWGAGAKGVTFSRMMLQRGASIEGVIDINPKKQGHFVAGSGLKIYSPNDAYRKGFNTAIVMNPAYLEEIRQMCFHQHLDIALICV